MMRNAPSCCAWRLYVILDRAASGGRALPELAASAIRGGADVLQLRDKAATPEALCEAVRHVLPAARAGGVPLIVNDRVDVAKAVGADGVHLGQEDTSVRAARRILGPGLLIGKSTHSLVQAQDADAEAVDYLGFGPVYSTPTKPDYRPVGVSVVAEVMRRIRRPVVCIGGIESATLPEVLAAGATCVAVVRAVCAAADPEQAARELKRVMAQFLSGSSAR